ncbi:response regulator transcription factor [Bradyrhizobium diazoefficiens]
MRAIFSGEALQSRQGTADDLFGFELHLECDRRGTSVLILVVEDDVLIREFMVEALREEGFDVIHASNGEEALQWCRRKVADVLVTDVKLPGGIDGWEIAERCREHDADLPVIYTTGFSPVQPRPVPGSVLMQKPYHPDEIVSAIRKATEDRSA